MRALLSFLLCLAIATQGIAYARAFEKPCSMNEGAVLLAMEHADSEGDCWDDGHAAGKTGKTCKTGQACSPSGAFVGTSFQEKNFARTASAPVLTGAFFIPTSHPSSIWKPPELS